MSFTHQSLAPVLLGIFMIGQIAYLICMHQEIMHEEDEFDNAGACTIQPGANTHSSLCMESQLFTAWNELPPEPPTMLQVLLEVSPDETPQPTSATPVRGSMATTTDAASQAFRGPNGQVGPESSKEADATRKQAGGDGSYEAADKTRAHSSKSSFMPKKQSNKGTKKALSSEAIAELQKNISAKQQLRADRRAEHNAIRALSAVVQRDTGKVEVEKQQATSWAQGLMDEMHEMDVRMKNLHKKREDHAAAFASAFAAYAAAKHNEQPVKEDPMTPWAHKLDNLTHDIQHHMEVRAKERAQTAAAHNRARDARIKAESVKSKSPLLERIQAAGQDLCQDPFHRALPSCAQFIKADSTNGSSRHSQSIQARSVPTEHVKLLEQPAEHAKLLEQHLEQLRVDQQHHDEEIRMESTAFLRELCADPARQSYPTCAHLHASTTAAPASKFLTPIATDAKTTASVSSSAHRLRSSHNFLETSVDLQWSALKDSEVAHQIHHTGAAPFVVGRQDLVAKRWESKVPKVACITVLPRGKVNDSLMRYFIDNYNLQHYDGPRQLVIVYDSADAEASRLAHLYANGTDVKIAAAQGGDEFPSTTAYRYGAWMAKGADLWARWDFEAFHHPKRLAMQVRAIALSKRPASILPKVTAFDENGQHAAVPSKGYAHGSMVGDAAWMRRHWMPVLEEESSALEGLYAGDVTQVAMPELLSYHDASMLAA